MCVPNPLEHPGRGGWHPRAELGSRGGAVPRAPADADSSPAQAGRGFSEKGQTVSVSGRAVSAVNSTLPPGQEASVHERAQLCSKGASLKDVDV